MNDKPPATTNISTDGNKSSDTLNLLPCSISHNGPANTSLYFHPKPSANRTLEASFRGRQLCGQKFSLPNGFIVHVATETSKDNNHLDAFESSTEQSSGEKELKSSEGFDSITVWGHDQVPDMHNDEFVGGLEWIEVADSIHS